LRKLTVRPWKAGPSLLMKRARANRGPQVAEEAGTVAVAGIDAAMVADNAAVVNRLG
jgi:hypothetical protein